MNLMEQKLSGMITSYGNISSIELLNIENRLNPLKRVINNPKDKNGIKAVSISFFENKLYIAGNKASIAARNIADTPN